MKVAIPVDSKQQLGGGFTFARNLKTGLKQIGVEIVDDWRQADIALVPSVSVISKETFREIRSSDVKMVIRLDNVPRNSRNRGSGASRLRDWTEEADGVVWQGEWAKWYLSDFVQKEGRIIHNGIDLNIFKPEGATLDFGNKDNVYLYSRYSRDETKMWEVAWYNYQLIQRENPNAKLILVGRYSDEVREYNFDFFRGEKIEYLGVIEDEHRMATLYRSCGNFLAVYFNDAFSNTYVEAMCSGVNLVATNMSGGTPEMLKLFAEHGRDYFSIERMANDYKTYFEEILNGRQNT